MCGSWLLVFLLIPLSEGLQVTPCAENGAVQVEESSQDWVLACEGLSLSHPVSWVYQGRSPHDSLTVISNCTDSTCQWAYNVMIQSSVNQHTRRSHVILPDVLRERFPDGTWWCHNGGQSARCAVDVIHKPEDAMCSVVIDEEKSMVSGECQISKMYSSHGDYSCTWFERTGNEAEVEIQQSHTQQLTLTNCSEGALYYVCGNCSFQKSLPLTDGGYSYRAVISPGQVTPSVRYIFVPKENSEVSSVTSTVTSQPSGQQTTSVQTPTVKEDNWPVRVEGVGMGVGLTLAVVVIIVIVVFICWRRRQRQQQQEKHCGDGLPLGDIPITVNCRPPASQPPAPAATRISSMRIPATENEYSSIDAISERNSKGGQQPRQLPQVPADSRVSVDTTHSDYMTPRMEAGNGYVNEACRDDPNQRPKLQQRLSKNGYIPMSPPCSQSVGFDFQRNESFKHGERKSERERKKEEEEEEKTKEEAETTGMDRKKEEEENMKDEHSEKATSQLIESAFQEKGADYIYMRHAGIPLSDPI